MPRAGRSTSAAGGNRPACTATIPTTVGTRRSWWTRRRPPCRARCMSAMCSATPRPTSSPATSACWANTCSTPWDGTTTACPPSAGCRTTSTCAAIRATHTSPASSCRWPPARRSSHRRGRCRGATSSSCAPWSPGRMSGRSWAYGRPSVCRWTGTKSTPPSTTTAATWPSTASWTSTARVTCTLPRRPPCGMSTSAPPWPRPRYRIGPPPATTTTSRSRWRATNGNW